MLLNAFGHEPRPRQEPPACGSTLAMRGRWTARELAYCGAFGAAALLLPVLFHLVRLGQVFMPMYLPLVTLAFFVAPLPAAATAAVVPPLSAALTGMPPFYPPVALFMALELALVTAVIAGGLRLRPHANEWLVLMPALCCGRVLYVALVYAFSRAIGLPAGFMAGLSVLSGWPGIVLMLVVVPPVARLRRGRTVPESGRRSAGDAKAAFFDAMADEWDLRLDLQELSSQLARGVEELGVRPDERILDVGCGTGNLTRALLERLSPEGRITAIDIAPRMIRAARRKIRDARVDFRVADARKLPLPDSSFDRVICFSVWPHIDDREVAAAEMVRVLKPGGTLHIWHAAARGKINEIHAAAGGPLRRDLLPPAHETAELLARCGLRVSAAVDDRERYLVTAARAGRGADDRRAG